MKKLKRFYKRFVTPIVQFRPFNIDTHWPILGEDTTTTSIDPHYFYQAIWAAQHIAGMHPREHVDVGSQVNFVGQLTALAKVCFVDVRPIRANIPNLKVIAGSILNLPFPDRSITSLSCLHVAEHIGLGRYGDPLDPHGTQKACAELVRVLAPGGTLYFSMPIGKERTEFNAHRVHAPATIVHYFPELTLEEFSAVDDQGAFIAKADVTAFDNAKYACGLFRFTRPNHELPGKE